MTSTCLIGLSLILSTAVLMGQKPLRVPKPLPGAPAAIAGLKEKPENTAAITGEALDKKRIPGNAPVLKSTAKPLDKDALLLAKFVKVVIDRRPSNILQNWAYPSATSKPRVKTQEHKKNGKEGTPVKKNPADIALEQLTLDIARGDWPAVGVSFIPSFKNPRMHSRLTG